MAAYASFSPDGGSFAAGTGSHTVRIWRTEDGMPIKTLVAPKTWPDEVTFSPDGRRILISAWQTISYATMFQVFGMCRAEQKSLVLAVTRATHTAARLVTTAASLRPYPSMAPRGFGMASRADSFHRLERRPAG